jgi:hypothetical protein
MSEFESLERELAEMRPRLPSAELKGRIADRLSSSAPRLDAVVTSRRVRMRLAIGGAFVAAGLAAIVFWWGRGIESQPENTMRQLLLATSFDSEVPSVWSYRTALFQSPDTLDALLDRHSVVARRSRPEDANVQAFARLDSNINDLLGEL